MRNVAKEEGRIIPLLELEGPEHMAIDTFLLDQSIQSKSYSAYFRIYKWAGVWLSVGKNQRIPNRWKELAKENNFQIVRRPSGGSAVLHSGGITYSLIKANNKTSRSEVYYEQCKWLIECFSKLGVKLSFGNDLQNNLNNNCFESSTKADLIDTKGNKCIGSAQLWKKKHVLQHGEIILNPPKELWLQLFNQEPPNTDLNLLNNNELASFLLEAFTSYYSKTNWNIIELSRSELNSISKESYNFKIETS